MIKIIPARRFRSLALAALLFCGVYVGVIVACVWAAIGHRFHDRFGVTVPVA